jgi:hypothetical protein
VTIFHIGSKNQTTLGSIHGASKNSMDAMWLEYLYLFEYLKNIVCTCVSDALRTMHK